MKQTIYNQIIYNPEINNQGRQLPGDGLIVTIILSVYVFLSIDFLIIPQYEFIVCFVLLMLLIYRVSYVEIQHCLLNNGKYSELYNYLKSKKNTKKSDLYFLASILGDWDYVEHNKGSYNSPYFQILDLENMMLNSELIWNGISSLIPCDE